MIALVAGSYGFKALGVTTLGGHVERRLGPVVTHCCRPRYSRHSSWS